MSGVRKSTPPTSSPIARMARIAGKRPGTTSSDGVAIDEQFVVRGDWSGPDGARRVLREPAVDLRADRDPLAAPEAEHAEHAQGAERFAA